MWVTPILHPAYILRGQYHKEPAQQVTLHRVREGFEPEMDYTQPPVGGILFPTLEQWEDFVEDTLEEAWGLSIDIENAGPFLICVGFTQILRSKTFGEWGDFEVSWSLCLRIRLRGGVQYWSARELPKVALLLDRLLSSHHLSKVFHNGVTHDVPLLERMGFDVRGPLVDTMVMFHNCYQEMPKGLQYVCTLMLGSGVWKDMLDEGDDEDGKT